jgi:hypothetical protein
MRILHAVVLFGVSVVLGPGQSRAEESETLGAYLLRHEENRMTPLAEHCINKYPYMKASLTGTNERYMKALRKASADYLSLIAANTALKGPVPPQLRAADQEREKRKLEGLQNSDSEEMCKLIREMVNSLQINVRSNLSEMFSGFRDEEAKRKKPTK